jgi:type IV fimbrial biogenesis protein FimT
VLIDNHAGVSLVELMIGLAIMALLLVMGMPSFTTYLQNAKLRASAESFYAGVQKARAEAVSRNAQVEMILTTDDPILANDSTTNTSSTAQNWMVRLVNAPPASAQRFIEGKSGAEGSGQAQGVTPSVQVSGTDSGGNAIASVGFNGFGGTTLANQAQFDYTNPTGGACAPTGPMRCLRVVVSVGGQARLCDPAINAASDTRKCP